MTLLVSRESLIVVLSSAWGALITGSSSIVS
jgi:hypothetical protein